MPFSRRVPALVFLFAAAATMRAECPSTFKINFPNSACRFGSATVSATSIDGAAYAWLVTGGTIVSGNGTPRVVIAFNDVATAHAAVTVSAPGCVVNGQADIPLHDVLTAKITIGPGRAGDPLTISWSYTGGEPAAQALTGTDFPEPLRLPPSVRSYTYTPTTSGAKQVSIITTAGGARRRATGGGGDSASSCAVAPSVTAYSVEECAKPTMTIEAPSTVLAGQVFTARAVTEAQTVHWTITNGTPATADGKEVTVTAGKVGDVGLTVTAARAGCPSIASKSFAVAAVPELACDHPVATLSAGGSDCSGGTVNVTFQGTPPFHGIWSDGQILTTTSMTLARHINAPGRYTLVSFEDAACAGTVNGAANFDTLGPVAEVTGSGSCMSDAVVTARFTGRPPFGGQWSDGVTFNTTQTSIQRSPSAPGQLSINKFSFHDADCTGTILGSVDVHANPRVTLATFPQSGCVPYLDLNHQWSTYVSVSAQFSYPYENPVTVNWSDGMVTGASRGGSVTQPVTYTITSARDAYCPAVLGTPTAVTLSVSERPQFVIDNLHDGVFICRGVSTTAHLTAPAPPGAAIAWSVTDGTITAGQGTSTVTFTTSLAGGEANLTCLFTYSNQHCPSGDTRHFYVWFPYCPYP